MGLIAFIVRVPCWALSTTLGSLRPRCCIPARFVLRSHCLPQPCAWTFASHCSWRLFRLVTPTGTIYTVALDCVQ
ncbi:hypothetical protein PF010_g25701 [Phytophthora fragariae]|uniref:Uncharacterized protein n=1 Tax=Phytophthora fragariae TaxID=53985 RepID=A0A6A3HVQ9_9STRA|nr:hypothetical protein PF011_g24993 [Phytophthora fragariae]KAE9071875.1 hypothetical protein PF010_g25701 [Phytophthora fragariae]KAE9180578.1 hypothetical protein PF004_g24800 [Phytophthora fragariae]KAE9295022.1 hypothetical protein PF008_g24382 [Phytophthora fragariae]